MRSEVDHRRHFTFSRRFLKQTPSLEGYALVTMKTILMTADMTTVTTRPRVQLRPVDELLAARTHPALRRPPPATARSPLSTAKSIPMAKSAWVSPLSESLTEKLLYGALALSAIAGIAYCFLSVLDRVQNWPVFNAWVGQILGA